MCWHTQASHRYDRTAITDYWHYKKKSTLQLHNLVFSKQVDLAVRGCSTADPVSAIARPLYATRESCTTTSSRWWREKKWPSKAGSLDRMWGKKRFCPKWLHNKLILVTEETIGNIRRNTLARKNIPSWLASSLPQTLKFVSRSLCSPILGKERAASLPLATNCPSRVCLGLFSEQIHSSCGGDALAASKVNYFAQYPGMKRKPSSATAQVLKWPCSHYRQGWQQASSAGVFFTCFQFKRALFSEWKR